MNNTEPMKPGTTNERIQVFFWRSKALMDLIEHCDIFLIWFDGIY